MNLFEDAPDLTTGQYFTPEWAAIQLVERYFPELSASDLVLEPSAGKGAFLKAIPPHVPAFGVELDQDFAREAHARSGREVIHGDFRTVPLPDGITAIIGNPPFDLNVVESFLNRAKQLLPDARKCGLILPSYAMQTYGRVVRWLDSWNLRTEMLPRALFPGLSMPLSFVLYTRGRDRSMIGFALYEECADLETMQTTARELLIHGEKRKGAWQSVVEEALSGHGGEATIEQVYRYVEPRRPTGNQWWREQVRKVLQSSFTQVERGRYRMATA